MFSIGYPNFKQAIGQQRHANHGNEQPGIFQEQAAADLPRHRSVGSLFRLKRCRAIGHSITSSASASSVGGTVKPRALAVLRLITSSNFVGMRTGSSAGFAPLRM